VLSFDLPRFLAEVLDAAPQQGDVLLTVGSPPLVQVGDEPTPVAFGSIGRLVPFQTEAVVLHLLAAAPPIVATQLREGGAAHFAYSVPGMNRFRASVFSQRGSYAIVLRTIPMQVPPLADLMLPTAIEEVARERNGLVLVCGPAGSGRTTTIAAMVAEINRSRRCHIVTVEDPIEFLHRHDRAVVNQRQVGIDTPSLAVGLADALRQGAQVVAASEVHAAAEARLLLEVAETGHLVISTVRGLDSASGLSRLLSLLPDDERTDGRARLARVLRWVFAQRLIQHRTARRAVVEVWRPTRGALRLLEDGTLDSTAFADILRDGEAEGTVAFDRELERRVRAGLLPAETAVASAVLPRQIELRLQDLQGSAE
jgi:twitching motility protein PilT